MSQPAAQNPQPPTQSSAGINGLDPDRGTLNLGLAGAADGQQQQQSSAGVSLGQADNPNGLHDFIDLFPYTIDASLYSHPTSDRLCLDPPTMYLELAFYFVFMTAKTTWNLPVRAMNYLFQSMWLLLGLAYGVGKRRHQLRQGYDWNTTSVAGRGLGRHENELFADYTTTGPYLGNSRQAIRVKLQHSLPSELQQEKLSIRLSRYHPSGRIRSSR